MFIEFNDDNGDKIIINTDSIAYCYPEAEGTHIFLNNHSPEKPHIIGIKEDYEIVKKVLKVKTPEDFERKPVKLVR